ncbi:MAG: hypothetical protein AB1696_22110 [Planctomycetota bacterium]
MPAPYAKVEMKDGSAVIDTDCISAVVCPKGYVSGVKSGTFRDRRTGATDLGHGLDIVDFLMQPGPHPREGELPEAQQYNRNTSVHGAIEKHYVELPQICTQAKSIPIDIVQSQNFVAVKQHWTWTVATLGYRPGSRWDQTLVFPKGKRFFYSTDVVTSANDADCLILRIDFPGHLKHKQGDTFEEIYLSYHGRIPASEFLADFTPDAKFIYQRPKRGAVESIIRGYKIRGGPWLAGIALDPAMIWEAWCHQRGYVCFITEIGGYPIRKSESFGAVYIIGFFDSIEEMHATYDQHRGVKRLEVDGGTFRLAK